MGRGAVKCCQDCGKIDTIRIETADEPECTTITVDGKLSDANVEPVQTCCNEALAKGKPVRLHLRDVCTIDERARAMLRHVAAQGIHLKANGIYSSYIVEEIESAGRQNRRSSP